MIRFTLPLTARCPRLSASPRLLRRSSPGAARLGRMPAVRPFRAITYAPKRFAQPVIPERIRLPDEPDTSRGPLGDGPDGPCLPAIRRDRPELSRRSCWRAMTATRSG